MMYYMNNKQFKEIVKKYFATTVMMAFGLFMLMPLLWMISASLKEEGEVFGYTVQWIPKVLKWDNYKEVWFGAYPFYVFYLNSIKVTFTSVIGLVLTSTLAAYGFSKLKFIGRDVIFLIYLSTMMIPQQAILVPRFILFKNIGILNTHLSLILPGIFMTFGVFLLRQFFLTIPYELSEAAIMDGANHLRICFQIIMPLAKPAIVSLIIISFVWRWNNYEEPLIFLSTKELFTIPVALTLFIGEYETRYSLIMAASCSAVIPVLAVFLLGQKYFIQGVVTTGIKG